jgi:hypothetical protein
MQIGPLFRLREVVPRAWLRSRIDVIPSPVLGHHLRTRSKPRTSAVKSADRGEATDGAIAAALENEDTSTRNLQYALLS